MSVRVRFAPSPTGMLHIGAFRDALFKELFARHSGGQNILRIEDTDRTRYSADSEVEFIETLKWAGIEFDEGPHIGGPFAPYRQSERKELGIYAEWIRVLLEKGGAYKAFDTSEELDEMRLTQQMNKRPIGYFGGQWRDADPDEVTAAEAKGIPYVIRLKVRKGRKIVIEDAIRGRIEWDSDTIDDAVLIKSDGMPTYHFAAMVDDHLMGITHILRGEEWVSSAPKHAEIFDLFGWERPIFVHCPVIVGKDGKKLSKRHGATSVLDYAAMGYQPDPLKNFVALIGWSPGEDREVLSPQELVEAFSLDGLQPSPGRFDLDKLNWLNGHAIRSESIEDLAEDLAAYIWNPRTEAFWTSFEPEPGTPDEKLNGAEVWRTLQLLGTALAERPEFAKRALTLERERVHRLSDFGQACSFFLEEKPSIDSAAGAKWLSQPHVGEMFDHFIERLSSSSDETEGSYEELLKTYQSSKGFEKLGPVVHPTRVALTGRTFGPGLWELMAVLGNARIVNRLVAAKGWGA